MSNKKRKVSLDDYALCYYYFHRAIQNNRFLNEAQYDGLRSKAINAFSELKIDAPDEESVHVFQLWLDDFIDSATWGRCYRALNQKKYLVNNNHRTITLSDEAYSTLKTIANQKNMSFSQTLIELCTTPKNGVDEPTTLLKKNLDPIALKPLNLNLQKTVSTNKPTTALAQKSDNVISLFGDEFVDSFDEDLDSERDPFYFDEVPEWPRKPQGYDFRTNDSYKKYRKYIKQLTIKEMDEVLLMHFDKQFTLNYYLTTETAVLIGDDILQLRSQLLKEQFFSQQFLVNEFAMSKGINLPDSLMNSYADELMYYLGMIFGCRSIDITSGNRTPSVFIGNRNHVQIAYKMFHYLNAFLSEERDNFLKTCHKNTKNKNRYLKAGRHCDNLVSKMLREVLEDEDNYQFYSDEEEKALQDHAFRYGGAYCDENEPIGGWWDPKKHPFR